MEVFFHLILIFGKGEYKLFDNMVKKSKKRTAVLIQIKFQQWLVDLLNYTKAYLLISCCES